MRKHATRSKNQKKSAKPDTADATHTFLGFKNMGYYVCMVSIRAA